MSVVEGGKCRAHPFAYISKYPLSLSLWAPPLLVQVIRIMAANHLHRVAIVEPCDTEGFMQRFLGIVTQSSLVRFLHLHLAHLGTLARISVARLFPTHVDPDAVVALPSSTTAKDALRTMLEYGVSGCPIVSDAGVLVANVSVRDIRRLVHVPATEVDAVLALPVLEYLKRSTTDGGETAPGTWAGAGTGKREGQSHPNAAICTGTHLQTRIPFACSSGRCVRDQ